MATNPTISTFEELKKKIVSGELPPSESLREMDLAAQYNVSRNTVKKALLMLEKENFVIIEPNKGAKVRAYSMEEVSEFLELRAELESFIARLAVPHFDSERLRRLQDTLSEMKQHLDSGDLLKYSDCNRCFHMIIFDACPNRTAVNLTLSLKAQMSKYNSKTILVPGRSLQSFEEHSAILSAILARNAELTEALVRHHISNVRKAYEKYFSLLT
ncbi:HTH-type transcriptional regulator LutR [bioreactor metagenome]|uniref:HTH-type transcriptional regulator LutR n=1 Tax=bioreactor metagenome TaxID=1076179 RepID=A0A644Y920_9ZZZZ